MNRLRARKSKTYTFLFDCRYWHTSSDETLNKLEVEDRTRNRRRREAKQNKAKETVFHCLHFTLSAMHGYEVTLKFIRFNICSPSFPILFEIDVENRCFTLGNFRYSCLFIYLFIFCLDYVVQLLSLLLLSLQKIIFVLLFVTGHITAADDNKKATITANVTTVVDAIAIANATESSPPTTTTAAVPVTVTTLTTTSTEKVLASTTIQPLKLSDDLVLADKTASKSRSNGEDDDGGGDDDDDDDVGQPNSENGPTAKRTINSKFDGPIVVGEQVNLFTPNNDNGFARRQRINVQIIAPEPHNNGQFLKETVFVRQENNTVITTTTTTTATPTQRPTPPPRRKNIVVEQKFLAPIQAGLRLSHDARQLAPNDDDCDDDKTQRTHIVVTERNNNRIAENVDIQQNTKIQRVIYKEEPKQSQTFVFGARVPTTTQSPCEKTLPCSTPRVFVPATPRLRPTVTPRIVTSTVVSAPRIVTSPVAVISPPPSPRPLPAPLPVTQAPIKTVVQKEYIHLPPRIIEKPVIHKQVVQLPPQVQIVERPKIVPVVTEKPVYIHTHSEVPVVQKEYVQLPPKIIEKPVVHKQVVQLPPQVQIVERPKVVVQKEYVQLPPQEKIVPVEVEKLVVQEVPVNNVIEKHIEHPPTVVEKLVPYPVSVPSKPVEVQKIVQVPVDRVVEKPVQVSWFSFRHF